jgi:hypothetical protein
MVDYLSFFLSTWGPSQGIYLVHSNPYESTVGRDLFHRYFLVISQEVYDKATILLDLNA